jgi:DNA-directed RNA polymerase subunit N (RpoN/RPB10)
MIIPIKCFTCNHVLADKWVYFERECAKLDNPDKQPETGDKAELKNMDKKTVGKIMDDLGLTRMCCRRHFIGHKDLMDLI